ncbi:MAG: glucans biosynthesis glucosyltransferase MdoH [Planctomycetales bacterium]|nr:glucans biosynthesis glucosyltransferase MdoH [Planctomycetales bacterium]MBN8626756.1 glucans biosynthesis glucosyltransferase MdoH [Planctomycetota bacterium]
MTTASKAPMMGARAARLTLTVLTAVTTWLAAWTFADAAAADGFSWLDVASLGLFVLLFVWVAMSFWMATIGFVRLARQAMADGAHEPATSEVRDHAVPRTAIVMPIYNEDPHGVFARIRAIWESLQATGRGEDFDFYILSDTTKPEVWLAEELAWSQLQAAIGEESRVYYRHRTRNICRKSGNLTDFCKRWGSQYRFMVVLDADSVMAGETLVELARRMEADPKLGILQAPPQPVNRRSLFARAQQFAASLYGPIFMEGFAWWSQDDGNYWGHNAIIRTDAFARHCGLAPLPGKAPLGGEILSHDFVEAALMRRAGYKVRLAHDLSGSYEECPPTLIAFAQRDQRWCQGNLQHLRLIAARGLRPVSRFHFCSGVMSYLSSPVWLTFLLLSVAAAALAGDGSAIKAPLVSALWIFVATMAMLLLPKFWSWLLLAFDRPRRIAYGGLGRAALGLVTEVLLSIAVAPVMMAFHSTFVVATFLGKKVHWNAQQRDEAGISWRDSAAAHTRQALAALVVGFVVAVATPQLLPWLMPVLAGLLLAIPLSKLCSSVLVGSWLAKLGILATPEERDPPDVLRRCEALSEAAAEPKDDVPTTVRGTSLFARFVHDPTLLALHGSILDATDGQQTASPDVVERVRQLVQNGRCDAVAADDCKAVLSDAVAMAGLHRCAWTSRREIKRPLHPQAIASSVA